MTDSMNFGPEWLRNLSSEGTTGVNSGGIRYQLAEYRYGREEMLALFEKGIPAPSSLSMFSPLYSEQSLPPLALVPPSEEDRQWQVRGSLMGPSVRGGRGAAGPGERGGRIARGGRGGYQPFGRSTTYESGGGWGNGEQTDWSPRKEFNYSRSSAGGVDNWRRGSRADDDDGWRSGGGSHPTKPSEKWGRSSSWREGDDERIGPQDRSGRSWSENPRAPPQRRMWDDDHLPEWATVNLGEGGGTFDATGAFHGSDDEQDGKGGVKKDPLQKSASQHNITSKTQHVPLSTSKSALSLSKPPEPPQMNHDQPKELPNHIEEIEQKSSTTETEYKKEPEESPHSPLENRSQPIQEEPEKMIHQVTNQNSNIEDPKNRVDEDFDKLQEDLVLKLVVDEEPTNSAPHVPHSNGVQQPPPPNMMPPLQQDKWYYQDPQGDLQGPFLSSEMAEWFKAGYFSATLFVRRQCDERFCTLGDLVLHTGGNPFQTNVPIMAIKQEPKVPDEMMQYHQLMQAQLMRPQLYRQGEPWNALNTLQQRELLSQQILQQPQMPTEPYLPQPNGSALLQMINQFNQANQVKMAVPPPLIEKPPNTLPMQLDPLQALVQQMGGLQSLQRGMQPPGNMTPVMGPPSGMKHEPPMPPLHGLPVNGLPGTTVPVLPNNNMMGGMPKLGMTKMDGDGNMSFLQFLQKPQMEQSIDLESLWRKNQYPNAQPSNPSPPQVPQWQPSDKPISMWDMPTPPNVPSTPPEMPSINNDSSNLIKEKSPNEQTKDTAKEERKKKDAEEKKAKKEAEEKRKAEQKKLEAEKKQQEEKRKKEEERVKKELEKAKKESEEKRQRELAEKRRLKEQRKADEEARKKAEEQRKLDEQERERLATKEREEQQKKQAEYTRQVMASNQKLTRAAPWSQSASNQGLSLSEIQKLERERKAEQVVLLQQQRMLQQEQMPSEKPTNLQLNWANKPVKLSQVKSLAEIQAEEQERLMKVKATEKAHQKEKETFSPPASRIWQGQTLTWTNNDNAGFWDEPQQKPQVKINSEPKLVKQISTAVPKQVASKVKKPKKEEQPTNNNNASTTDEFTEWCSKTLAIMDTQVDIPTFVTFLRDIESAMDVREYCRDYLGDKPATQQFAAQFLEKRRLYRPKVTTHKDDMCSPAPAITPSSQHNNSDFQEVKGKGKKCKKSKMLKVDARILGFNVTAAEDRINVGARDYGDNI